MLSSNSNDKDYLLKFYCSFVSKYHSYFSDSTMSTSFCCGSFVLASPLKVVSTITTASSLTLPLDVLVSFEAVIVLASDSLPFDVDSLELSVSPLLKVWVVGSAIAIHCFGDS